LIRGFGKLFFFLS